VIRPRKGCRDFSSKVRCAALPRRHYASMSVVGPIIASSRDPAKPRSVPKHIRTMVEIMVRGRPGDPDCAPLSFIEAAKIAGVAPDVARRWLDRAEVRSFLRAERRAFRDTICAANEHHLARIRGGPNAAAAVRAIAVLEELDQAETHPARGTVTSPGLAIVIVDGRVSPPVAPVVDVTPRSEREPGDDRGF
jgi:hypothetical protein